MKRLGKTYQISAQSHQQIVSGLARLAEQLVGKDETFLGRKLKPGHVLNGLVLLLLDEADDEQFRLAVRALRRLEAWAMEQVPPSAVKGFGASAGDNPSVSQAPASGTHVENVPVTKTPNDLPEGQRLNGNDVVPKANRRPAPKRRAQRK